MKGAMSKDDSADWFGVAPQTLHLSLDLKVMIGYIHTLEHIMKIHPSNMESII